MWHERDPVGQATPFVLAVGSPITELANEINRTSITGQSANAPGAAKEMWMPEVDSFPPGVASRLKTYVYRLIDPRNGETFYIGKGQGDRVFAHIRAQVPGDEVGEKLNRIREIRLPDLR